MLLCQLSFPAGIIVRTESTALFLVRRVFNRRSGRFTISSTLTLPFPLMEGRRTDRRLPQERRFFSSNSESDSGLDRDHIGRRRERSAPSSPNALFFQNFMAFIPTLTEQVLRKEECFFSFHKLLTCSVLLSGEDGQF